MVAYLLSKHLVNLLINLVYHKLKCLLFCLPFWIFAWSFLLRELTLHSMNRSWIQRGPVIPLYCCHPEHLWEKHFNRLSWICLCSILTDIYFSQKWNILKLTCVCAQLWLTLCDPMDCSLPGSSVHGIFQARILQWVAISYSRGPFRPRDWTHFSCVSYIGRRILYHCATWEAPFWPLCTCYSCFLHTHDVQQHRTSSLHICPQEALEQFFCPFGKNVWSL